MFRKFSSMIRHTSHVTTILFVVGFVIDMIILPDIDHPLTRYIGLAHLTVVAILIMFREWVVSRNTASKLEQKLYSLSSFGISFSSGAALSFICVYAFRSAALSVSWPLFLILAVCIIANEFVSTHGFRLALDVGILLIASLFFAIFNIPVLLKVQNDVTFLISTAVTVVFSIVYVYLLQFTSESAKEETPKIFALALGIPMFVGMLYILNVIPAVPLSLNHAGVYHSVIRTSEGAFIVYAEKEDGIFLRRLIPFRTLVYHMTSTDSGVYFFSAVHAPAEITAPLSHVWEEYDEKKKQWVERSVISFGLEGGRADGYRAYSFKESIDEGLWRVSVKVDTKRVVGRYTFFVERKESVILEKDSL